MWKPKHIVFTLVYTLALMFVAVEIMRPRVTKEVVRVDTLTVSQVVYVDSLDTSQFGAYCLVGAERVFWPNTFARRDGIVEDRWFILPLEVAKNKLDLGKKALGTYSEETEAIVVLDAANCISKIDPAIQRFWR